MHPHLLAFELQKFGRNGIQAIGYVAITLTVALLLLTWMSATLLFQAGVCLGDLFHLRLKPI